jgi:hypothetical protein
VPLLLLLLVMVAEEGTLLLLMRRLVVNLQHQLQYLQLLVQVLVRMLQPHTLLWQQHKPRVDTGRAQLASAATAGLAPLVLLAAVVVHLLHVLLR